MKNGTTKMTVLTRADLRAPANRADAIMLAHNDEGTMNTLSSHFTCTALIALLTACAAGPDNEVREQLDQRTGVTVTRMKEALQFYSAASRTRAAGDQFRLSRPARSESHGAAQYVSLAERSARKRLRGT